MYLLLPSPQGVHCVYKHTFTVYVFANSKHQIHVAVVCTVFYGVSEPATDSEVFNLSYIIFQWEDLVAVVVQEAAGAKLLIINLPHANV